MMKRFANFLLLLLVAVAVAACQTIADKRKIDYKSTRTLPPLEIPPDLATPEGIQGSGPVPTGPATYSGFISGETQKKTPAGSGVLPEFEGARIERIGQMRWLVVKLPVEQVWPQLREFVLNRGLIVDKENSQTGVLETDWAENRANIGTGIQRLLHKSLGTIYSTGTRDKFRFRLERGAMTGTTEIYLSHRGMEEVIVGSSPDGIGETRWQGRPSDPELEAEMLRQLLASLGAKEEYTRTVVASIGTETLPERSRLVRQGESVALNLSEDFERAWRRVGLVLDRSSFTVEDRDRSKGIYYVRYIDPDVAQKKKGFFSRFFSEAEKEPPKEYQIVLKGSGSQTLVNVLSKEGAPEPSKTSERILTLLHEQLK